MSQGDSFEFEGLHFELIKKIRQKMVQFKVFTDGNDFKEANDKNKNVNE